MVLRAGGGSIQCLQYVMWTVMIKKIINQIQSWQQKFSKQKKRCETGTSEKNHQIYGSKPRAQNLAMRFKGMAYSFPSINPSLMNHGHPWGQTGRRQQTVLRPCSSVKQQLGKKTHLAGFMDLKHLQPNRVGEDCHVMGKNWPVGGKWQVTNVGKTNGGKLE